jgi:hypothetical protein
MVRGPITESLVKFDLVAFGLYLNETDSGSAKQCSSASNKAEKREESTFSFRSVQFLEYHVLCAFAAPRVGRRAEIRNARVGM